MDKKEQIRQSLQLMAARFGPLNTMLAQVVSVNEDALTCELIADELEVYDVRLTPVLTGNQSVVLFPKINSWVLCARIEQDEDWMVMSAEEVDKYRITAGDMVFEMDGEKFLFKNGEDDLKKLMDDLFDAILAMSFTTNTGVTIKLVNAIQFQGLKTRVDALLKSV